MKCVFDYFWLCVVNMRAILPTVTVLVPNNINTYHVHCVHVKRSVARSRNISETDKAMQRLLINCQQEAEM